MEALFEAAKRGIKQQPIDLEIKDEAAFFKAVVSSGLSGVIFPYLDPKMYSDKLNQKANGVLYQFIEKDQKQQALIESLRKRFTAHQIDFIFLKGTKLKSLYPQTYMRGMGDVDVLVRSDLDVIKQLFSKEHIQLVSRTLAHDHYHTQEGLLIEIHPSIHNDFNPKYQTYFKEAWHHATPVSAHEYTLEPTFELVYLLYHLAKHIESSGIGIRSLLDIGIYRINYDSRIDDRVLTETLEKLNMTQFYNIVMTLNKRYFDLEVYPITKGFELSESSTQKMTDYFLTSGIHGKGESFNAMAPRLAASKNKRKSKYKVLLRIAFPKMRDARGMYPVLYKHPYLYPVMMFHRNFQLIFFKRKSSIKKLHDLNESDVYRKDIEALFEEMGIY